MREEEAEIIFFLTFVQNSIRIAVARTRTTSIVKKIAKSVQDLTLLAEFLPLILLKKLLVFKTPFRNGHQTNGMRKTQRQKKQILATMIACNMSRL